MKVKHIFNSSYLGIIRQWPRRPRFNPRSSHAKDSKNGSWCHLAQHSALQGTDQG